MDVVDIAEEETTDRQLELYLSKRPVLEGFNNRVLMIEIVNDSMIMAKFLHPKSIKLNK